ncbi:hypothetical protein QKW60_08295 [Defluviimonas aestuarii]|uniref:hypothetical protein n=1 Tax=Albidovulum aestuarii TaxID=1130726 RepID=UPI00249CE044|nr:hypothetical protein [Defluviimonas aestuarii]MDI3336402.1 hypothetical protein [Defluviimonas aestuarii]
MSGPEGWDGKSVRRHVEAASAEAAEARELAEKAHDEIATLSAELAELAGKVLPTNTPEGGDNTEDGATAMNRAALFPKVKFIRSEIASWRLFMVEVDGIRAALAEWRRLENALKGSRE